MAIGTGSPTMYLGVQVEDERPDTTVPVSIGFTTIGTGAGTLQVAQSSVAYDAGSGDQTAVNNLSWQTAVNEYGQTPEDTGLSGNVNYATAISNLTGGGVTYNSRRAYAESINELFLHITLLKLVEQLCTTMRDALGLLQPQMEHRTHLLKEFLYDMKII